MIKVPKFSLVYTFYNQLDYLKYQILVHTELARLDLFDFEFICVDDGSNDETQKWVRKKETSFIFPFQYIRLEKDGMRVGLAKNEGIKAASGDYIFINDGDTFPTPTSYIRLISAVNYDQAVFGKRVRFDWDKIVDRKNHRPSHLELAVVGDGKDWRGDLRDIPPAPYTHFSGANALFPAADLKKIGWVPADWSGYGFDDYVCALNWLGVIKKPLIAVNDSIAYHVNHPNTTPDDLTNLNRMKKIEKELSFDIIETFGGGVLEGGY